MDKIFRQLVMDSALLIREQAISYMDNKNIRNYNKTNVPKRIIIPWITNKWIQYSMGINSLKIILVLAGFNRINNNTKILLHNHRIDKLINDKVHIAKEMLKKQDRIYNYWRQD